MKKFFHLDRGAWIEFALATVLLVTNLILTLKLPYYTTHKAYYESSAYIVVLIAAYVLYFFRLFLTKKKSANDIAVVLFGFFLLWEVAYKVGWVHNDLLIMVEAAEAEGKLKPGGTIVEGSSGNTGIGLAMVSAAKGYPAIICLAEDSSREKIKLLKAYGAQVELTPKRNGFGGGGSKAKELAETVLDILGE